MNIKTYIYILFIIYGNIQGRSHIRASTQNEPYIITYNPHEKESYIFRDSIIEWYPVFSLYDMNHFQEYLLPDGPISLRYEPKRSILGTTIKKLLEKLYQEIKEKKKEYEDFIILKKRDFNVKKQAGCLVVKFKKYPFVAKIFMENPRSFVRPYNKGFEASCQFVVGGGITRHALGFTRIMNSLYVANKIQDNPELQKKITVPRKWFWRPTTEENFHIEGHNFTDNAIYFVKAPKMYVVIADAIEIERSLSLQNPNDSQLGLEISNTFDFMIDPHINNFVIEKGTGKIAIIDTEHFPTLVGLKKRPTYTSYFNYYYSLAKKFLKDRYGRIKKERNRIQTGKELPFHSFSSVLTIDQTKVNTIDQ